MNAKYFGLVSFETAQLLQTQKWSEIKSGISPEFVLGMEIEPTVTLGARSAGGDVFWLEESWRERGFKVAKADRGGQATIHNPGQLVIFPTLDIRNLGVRRFVCLLSEVTRKFLAAYGCETKWREEDPGLYTSRGKVMSVGLRVRCGIATHGLSINVHNDLTPFQGIRVCGRAGAAVDRLRTEEPLSELFSRWTEELTAQLTTPAFSRNLGSDNRVMRL